MFDKSGIKTLVILFGVLLIAVIYLLFFSSGGERSFRKDLVNIDTAKVNEISILPKNAKDTIDLIKIEKEWKIKLPNSKTASVPKNKVISLLNDLVKIKPTVLASRNKDEWKELQVDDSSASRIKVFENGNPALDIFIGKIAFQQPNSISTYVRLHNDVDVYKTEGYLGMTLGRTPSDFRNTDIVKSSKSTWQKLTFQYPADSSFVLARDGSKWKISNTYTDSAKTEQLLNNLEHVSALNFNDNFKPADFQKPVYKLFIDINDTTTIRVDGYMDSSKVVLHSSQNPESYFDDNKAVHEKLFLSQKRFLK